MQTTASSSIQLRFSAAALILLWFGQFAGADDDAHVPRNHFAALHQPNGDWYEAGDAMLNPGENRLLVGKPGTGVLINGETGRTASLVTKETYQDVQVHVEFMVAKGSNSGVIFHGNYEIQILDSAHIEAPTGAHCGGVYPRAEGEPGTPSYRHIDKGSPPRVNAAKPPGQWQTMDIIFQSPRFNEGGSKTANAKFVKVVHNGVVVQENHEMPYAHGPNWDRKQFPNGRVVLQGDYGPIAFRNIRVRPWKAGDEASAEPQDMRAVRPLNVPPEGFTALFNGRDLTGWHTRPEVSENWFVEDGVLRSTTLVEHYRASLLTKKRYRDFILMLEFRMPTISDSGICFRRLIPEIPGFGTMEQFNLRSRGGMGHLESYYFLPKETAEKVGLKEEEKPHVRHIDPEVGVWHKVKLTMKGRTFSAEYDGEVLHDNFQFHDWMMNMEPAPILLQKHMVVRGDNLGDENPCPIEYRNVFIKELGPGDVVSVASSPTGGSQRKPPTSPNAELLARIDAGELPKGYVPAKHQEYVDEHWPKLSPDQVARALQLWEEKQKIDPEMANRGYSFVKIMTYVADGERLPAENNEQPEPSVGDRARSHGETPESRSSRPVHAWKWSSGTAEQGTTREASPFEIPEGPTIYVVQFGVLEDDNPPVVLLPESRLAVTGCLATAHPVYFGITIDHPNGDFAGRFVTMRPADEFQSGKGFQVTLDLKNFRPDSSLDGMKDKLPTKPFHFVVESIWFTTLQKEAGLEITEVTLVPPTQEESN